MNDRGLSVLEQYDIKVKNSFRGRGSLICDTDQGLKLIKEFHGSAAKLEFQSRVQEHIRESGYPNVDVILRNREGSLISADKDEIPYIVKNWFDGRECDTKSEDCIVQAVRNLASLHKVMQMPLDLEEMEPHQAGDMLSEYERHNRELRRVFNFVKTKRKKNDFELTLLADFNYFFNQGKQVTDWLHDTGYDTFRLKCLELGQISHGEYNHHNILVTRRGTAVTNFDRCMYDIQGSDLYHFMRKILEKQNWNLKVGMMMLEEYDKIRPLCREEREYLYMRLSYPEKYWKLANHYFNSNKAWIPAKNVEKVKNLTRQKGAREAFLERML